MTQADARNTLHAVAEFRRAFDAVASEKTRQLLLSWSEQVYNALAAEKVTALDIDARGGPSERTIGLMLKAGNTRVSTMVEFATALSSDTADYEVEIKLIRKPKP